MEIAGYLSLAAVIAVVLWIGLRRHTGVGREWCADGGTPGSEED